MFLHISFLLYKAPFESQYIYRCKSDLPSIFKNKLFDLLQSNLLHMK